MSQPEVVVVGSVNLDLVVPVDRHPAPGETVLGGDAARYPGGKGANQAVAAARLGRRVAFAARVGDDDAGRVLVAALADDGVDTSAVATTPGAPSGLALITVDSDGENMIVVSPGANARLSPGDLDAVPALAQAPVVLLQLEIPDETVLAVARRAGGRVMLNPAPAKQLTEELLAAVDVLIPNRTELALIAGGPPPTTIDEALDLARRIDGPNVTIVTMGADGALVVVDGDSTHVPAVEVDVVDTTAAGDSFCGALADAFVGGAEPIDAVEWAVAAAALTTTRRGAQSSLPTRGEVEVLARRKLPRDER